MAGRSWDSLYHLTFEAPKILYYSGLNKSTTKSNTAAEVVKFHIILSGLLLVCGLESCVPVCACKPPAPLLSFSCVKKKDGGERKSLRGTIRRAWGDTPHWKNVAAPRSSSPHRGNKTLLKPLCRCGLRPFIKGIEFYNACVPAGTPASCRGDNVLAHYRPRLDCTPPHVAEVGRPTPLGLRCMGRMDGL